jgi:hypothetical protein
MSVGQLVFNQKTSDLSWLFPNDQGSNALGKSAPNKNSLFVKVHNKIFFLSKLQIGLYHPLDGFTNPKYKLLRSLRMIFWQREEDASF